MVAFQPNSPVTTAEPAVTVDGGLPPGTYTFRLVVVDDDGNRSEADEQEVTITRERTLFSRSLLDEFRTTTRTTGISGTTGDFGGTTIPRL